VVPSTNLRGRTTCHVPGFVVERLALFFPPSVLPSSSFMTPLLTPLAGIDVGPLPQGQGPPAVAPLVPWPIDLSHPLKYCSPQRTFNTRLPCHAAALASQQPSPSTSLHEPVSQHHTRRHPPSVREPFSGCSDTRSPKRSISFMQTSYPCSPVAPGHTSGISYESSAVGQ
jgi:hypothetical protein